MSRSATTFLVLLTISPPAFAQMRNPGEPIPLEVSGAAVPTPSLKYRLLLDRRDQTPGNAATLYYRAHAILYENSGLLKELKEVRWYEWMDMPFDELPLKEVREKLQNARHVIRELDLAGRRRECNWQLDGREEGIGLLLPEVQGYRNYASVLAVRARLDMVDGNHAGAIETIRSGLALGRNLAEGPTLIHALVGLAVSQVTLRQLEALIQQPEAPNLYWALTVLPAPFIDPRKAAMEESQWVDQMVPFAKRLEGGPMTLAELQAVMAQMEKRLDDFGLKKPDRAATLARAAYVASAQKEARLTLIKQGLKAETVEAMPAFQVVSLFAFREFRDAREEVLKWVLVPEGMKHPSYQQAAEKYRIASVRMDQLFFRGLLGGLEGNSAPAYEKVFNAGKRLDRRLAALRCVEALRLHAARHKRWPAKLDDVKDVPVPVDPWTGKPFVYRYRNASHVVLATPDEPGDKPQPFNKYTYELALRQ